MGFIHIFLEEKVYSEKEEFRKRIGGNGVLGKKIYRNRFGGP